MAENKVVNTTQLDADLTSIANAIRAKAESSDTLVFPSGFVDAIANIVTGGGVPTEMSKIDAGTYTFAEDKINATIQIAHNLGEAPDFYVFYKQGNWSPSTSVKRVLCRVGFNKKVTYGSSNKSRMWIGIAHSSASTTSYHTVSSGLGDGNCTFDTTTFGVRIADGFGFASGDTFNWICGKMITQ